MVRGILFVVVSGFIVLFGGMGAISTAQNETVNTAGTASVIDASTGVIQGLSGLLFGLMFLVMLSAVLMLNR